MNNSAIATPPPSRPAGEQNRSVRERSQPAAAPLPPAHPAGADLVIEDLTADPWPAPPPGICICTVTDH
ncbi:hypothetical protein ACQUSR_22005 [Streptomyces sp. P1-3]|uniref:hypothetical protein n=1 Tax=Streptomyces sp. P1-3 TaxID=3421658 RepID=UPI003D35BBC1